MNYDRISYEQPFSVLLARMDALEAREKELAEALLDYVIADLAEPWVPAARRLEAVLVARLKK